MAFTAKDVQTLREMTGVGMMDCKKALTASDGDMDKAVEFLREKGLAASQKKASRIAAEGIVCACVLDNGVAAMAEVNIETDFAAKNPDFQKFAEDITKVVAEKNPSTVEELMEMNYPGTNNTVAEIRQERVLVIGENIQIRRFAINLSVNLVSYILDNADILQLHERLVRFHNRKYIHNLLAIFQIQNVNRSPSGPNALQNARLNLKTA